MIISLRGRHPLSVIFGVSLVRWIDSPCLRRDFLAEAWHEHVVPAPETVNVTTPDPDLPALRLDVDRLLGRTIIRLQIIERATKAIVANHQVSAPIERPEQERSRSAEAAEKMTLGGLITEMTRSFLVSAETGRGQEPVDDLGSAASISVRHLVVLHEDDFQRVQNFWRDLVTLRNTLVHHFLDEHDLRTAEGCRAAAQSLIAAEDMINRATEELKGYHAQMDQARKAMADHLVRSEIVSALANPIWENAEIVFALRDAADALSGGGWTPVARAGAWMKTRDPDLTAEGHGFRSLRQLIHETRLFDLRHLELDDRRQAHYRPLA